MLMEERDILAYKAQEEATDDNLREVVTKLLYGLNKYPNRWGKVGGSYRSQSRDQAPCDGHESEVQPRGRNSIHNQVRGHLHLCAGSAPVANSGFLWAYENITGKEDGQRSGVLCVIEVQVLLKAREASIGQIAAL
jgi:hypothetical protein